MKFTESCVTWYHKTVFMKYIFWTIYAHSRNHTDKVHSTETLQPNLQAQAYNEQNKIVEI